MKKINLQVAYWRFTVSLFGRDFNQKLPLSAIAKALLVSWNVTEPPRVRVSINWSSETVSRGFSLKESLRVLNTVRFDSKSC